VHIACVDRPLASPDELGMTRIAHLTTVHHPSDPRIFRKQLRTLAEAGFEVHLVVPNEGRSETRRGVRVTGLPAAKGRYRRAWLQPQLVRAARRLDAALYHFHDPELIPAAYLLKRLTGARVIYDMHENYRWKGAVEGRLLRALERWCFRWVDHVVVANAAHQCIPATSGASATVVANYYKPPDEAVPSNDPPPLRDLRAAYTGVMGADRGLVTMLDLAALFKKERPRWRLDLAGVCYRPGDRRRAETRVRKAGLAPVLPRTDWSSYAPWRTIQAAHERAHVGLALFSDEGGFPEVLPTKFYEYLHAGLPILCSDLERWRAFVERHDCGAVVPPGEADAAFDVLRRWAADPARYRRLSENARAAASQYQWPKMGRRLVRLYNRLLGTQRPLPPAPEEASASL